MTHREQDSRDGGPWLFEVLSRHRRLAAITVMGLLTGAVIGLLAGRPGEPEYQAKAVVVASALEMRVEFLPRTAAAIFEGGRVAEIAAARIGGDVEPGDLIPHIVDLEPVENTPVVNVVAEHPDPEVAAQYATAAAEALVLELNRVGPGLGTFVLNVRAPVPTDPIPASRLPALAGGLLAGLAFAAGIVALSLLLRPAEPDEPSDTDEPPATENPQSDHAGPQVNTDVHRSAPTPPQPDQAAPEPALPPRATSNDGTQTLFGSIGASPGPTPADAPRDAARPPAPLRPATEGKPSLNGGVPPDPVVPADDLTVVRGIGKSYAARLGRAGIHTVAELAAADSADIAARAEVRPSLAAQWIGRARQLTEDLSSSAPHDGAPGSSSERPHDH